MKVELFGAHRYVASLDWLQFQSQSCGSGHYLLVSHSGPWRCLGYRLHRPDYKHARAAQKDKGKPHCNTLQGDSHYQVSTVLYNLEVEIVCAKAVPAAIVTNIQHVLERLIIIKCSPLHVYAP
jgi:hypothetical protein